MLVTIGANIRITLPTPEVVKWCNKNLVIPNPDYEKKVRLGLWTGKTPMMLTLYERDGNTLVLPFGTLKTIWPLIKDKAVSIGTTFLSPWDVDYGRTPVPLYDYQKEAVEKMIKAGFGILQSAAGSGKTQMGIAIVKQLGKRALWLTHTQDLLQQSKERAERYIPEHLIGTITAGKVSIGMGITFATVQTMCKLDLDHYRDMWDVIIVDECHHVSGSPTTMTQFYRVLNRLVARHKYGLSATVHRADGLIIATHAMLGPTVYTVPDEAVADKIMKVCIHPVATHTTLSEECLNPDGTLNYTRLINYLSADPDRNKLILEDIINNSEHSCLILSDRIEHLTNLMNSLPYYLRQWAVMITGKMTSKTGKAEREAALEQMRKGEKRFLFASYALAKEGLDIPRLERLFMATPVKDEAVVIQSVGRIARTFPNKKQPVAYDYVDNIRFCQRAYKERVRHYKKIDAECV